MAAGFAATDRNLTVFEPDFHVGRATGGAADGAAAGVQKGPAGLPGAGRRHAAAGGRAAPGGKLRADARHSGGLSAGPLSFRFLWFSYLFLTSLSLFLLEPPAGTYMPMLGTPRLRRKRALSAAALSRFVMFISQVCLVVGQHTAMQPRFLNDDF